jgi:hypothetical protein
LEATLHDDYEGYKANVKRLVQVLKPGGHLFIGTMLGMNFYYVDGKKILTQILTKERHEEALVEAGLMIKKEAMYAASSHDCVEGNEADFTHFHLILAQKLLSRT